MMRSGVARSQRAVLRSGVLAVTLLLNGCLYGFSGGGGLPRNLKSVAIQPFDNQTASAELQREVFEETRRIMKDRLNLREAPELKADLVVKGTIVKYEVDLPAGVSSDSRQTTSTRRRLQLVIDIEILESSTGRSIFKKAGMQTEGQYPEGGEVSGRKQAIESFATLIVEGMQSQW